MTGSLMTVRGETRPLSFYATVSGAGSEELQAEAEVRVDRGDFGPSWNQPGTAFMNRTVTIRAASNRT